MLYRVVTEWWDQCDILTCEDISFDNIFLPLELHLNLVVWLKYLQIYCLQQSLIIFTKCSEQFICPFDKFWKIFRNLGKVVEISGKLPEISLFIANILHNEKKTLKFKIYLLVLKNMSLIHCTPSWNIFQHWKKPCNMYATWKHLLS